MMDTNIIEFFSTYFMIEMNHSVSIAGQLSQEFKAFLGDNFFFEKSICYLSVFYGGISKFFSKNVPANVKEGFKSAS